MILVGFHPGPIDVQPRWNVLRFDFIDLVKSSEPGRGRGAFTPEERTAELRPVSDAFVRRSTLATVQQTCVLFHVNFKGFKTYKVTSFSSSTYGLSYDTCRSILQSYAIRHKHWVTFQAAMASPLGLRQFTEIQCKICTHYKHLIDSAIDGESSQITQWRSNFCSHVRHSTWQFSI